MSPLTGPEVLERYHLEVRAKLIEVAAVLDRLGRSGGLAGSDVRLERIHQAMQVLADPQPNKAEALQMLFSLPYEATWRTQYGV